MARAVLLAICIMNFVYAEASSAGPPSVRAKAQTVLLLRWVLIVATAYLVVFSRPLDQNPASSALFVAVYFASNIVLIELLPRFSSQYVFDCSVVVIDTVMVSIGLALTGAASSEFYVVYFLVMFVTALTERLGLVVGAAVLISTTHMYTELRLVGPAHLMNPAYILRVPFLFVVAMFFGHLVEDTRTQERQDSEASARARRMEFLAGVSHDLKNPLGVIQTMASFLLDGDAGALNDQQADLVRRIHATTRNALTFALNMIDAARIDAGRLVLQRRPVVLREFVEDTLLLARSAAELKGIELQSSVADDLPPAHVDAAQIERVIANLVGNAIKFTPPGGTVQLSVRAAQELIVLAVGDTGPGIPVEELATVFDKYNQHAERGRPEGSGLGLFIVKAIVEAHGGTVAIASTLGSGTKVTVHLPVAPANNASNASDVRMVRPQRRWWWPFARTVRRRASTPIRAVAKG